MKDYLARLRRKPEHVRRRVAFGVSVGVTALVGVIWITTMVSTGAFALGNGTSGEVAADAPQNAPVAITGTNVKSNFSQLMGAASAAVTGSSSQPSLTIIDGKTTSSFTASGSTTSSNTNSATVIPF